MILDDRRCELGEGPLWHPLRQQLFWFDITGRRLLTRKRDELQEWHFAEMVSAAGWISAGELLIASERGLFQFDLVTGDREPLASFGTGPGIRSNDGRADRQGGFWASTMGKGAEPGAGAIWRWYRGRMRRLFDGISIPNAICFAPDGRTAHFADTATQKVFRVALDTDGWPLGVPSLYLDLAPQDLNPDGAVIDATGRMWLALWGAGGVASFAPDGTPGPQVAFDAPHTTCPAFGGTTLYCTSALQGMDAAARAAHPQAGMTHAARDVAQGLDEPQVII